MAGPVLSPDEILAGSDVTSAPLASVMQGVPGVDVPGGGGVAPPEAAPTAPRPSGRTVRLLNPAGELRDVPEENLDRALALGFRQESAVQTAAREYVEENRGLKGAAKVGLLQFADEALFGIPELVYEKKADPLDVAKWEALKADHQLANAIGGVGGFAASTVLPGVSALGKGASLAGKAAERGVLDATERVVASRLAAAGVEAGGKRIAAQVVQKALASGAKLGTEALVYAAPQAMTEAALGDPEGAAETVMWAMGSGAVLGGVGAVGKEIFSNVTKSMSGGNLAEAAEKYANEQAIKSHNPYKRISDRLGEVRGGEQAAGKTIREYDLVRRGGEDFEALGARIADARTSVGDAINEHYSVLEKYGAIADARDVAQEMRREVLAPLQKAVGYEGKAAKVERYIDSFLEKTGGATPPTPSYIPEPKAPKIPREPKLPSAPKPLTEVELARELQAKFPEIEIRKGRVLGVTGVEESYGKPFADVLADRNAERMEGHVHDVAEALATHDGEVSRIRSMHAEELGRVQAENAARKARYEELKNLPAELGVQDVLKIRRDLDALIYGEKMPSPDQVDASYKAIRGILKGTLERSAGELEGPEYLQRLDKLNRDFQVLSILQNGAKKNVGRDITNRSVSLTDYISGNAATSVGSAVGHAIGGPLGGVVAGPAVTALGTFGNKWMRENYNRLAVQGAEKFGVLFAEQAMKRAGERLDEIPSILDRMGKATPSKEVRETFPARVLARFAGEHDAPDRTREAEYEMLSTRLAQTAADLEGMTSKIASLTAPFSDGGAPKIAEAYAARQQAVLQHLLETMPKVQETPALFGSKRKTYPPEREILGWIRRVEVTQDPFAVLRHLEAGTLTREHVETLSRVSPWLLGEIRKRILDRAADPKAPVLSSLARSKVQLLLGMEASSPDSLRRLQSMAPQDDAGKIRPLRSASKVPSEQTSIQRISMR